MQHPRTLRLSITMSLALAGLAAAGGALLYQTDPARAQVADEGPEGVEREQPEQPELGDDSRDFNGRGDRPRDAAQQPQPQQQPGDADDAVPAPLPESGDLPPGSDGAPAPGQPASGGPGAPGDGGGGGGAGEANDGGDDGDAPPPPTRGSSRFGTAAQRAEQAAAARAAQAAGDDPEGPSDDSATRPAATTRPATTRSGVTRVPANGNGGILLNFKDASIDAVLDELSETAGFVVVKQVPVNGRITLVSKQPVDAEEAVTLLNTVLKTNGYAAIRMGRVLKVLPLDAAKTTNIPVRVGKDPLKIEPTDELITQVIPVDSADVRQLREDLAPLISAQADFSANANSNSLIITDTSANIRRIVEVVAALDTSMAGAIDVRVHKLKFASATSAAQLVNSVFGQQGQPGQQQGGFPGFGGLFGGFGGFGGGGRRGGGGGGGGGFPGLPGGGGGGGGQQQGEGGRQQARVSASADDRTNTLVVTGPPDTLDVVKEVIEQIDSDPTENQSVFVYSLRNADALQLESVINSLFNGTGGSAGNRSVRGGGVGRTAQRSQTFNSGTGRGGGGFGGGGRGGGGFGGGGGGFGGGGGGFGGGGRGGFGGGGGFGGRGGFGGGVFGGFGGFGGISGGSQRVASDLAGQVTVVAEQDTNSLLVMTSPKNFDRVQAVIDELDRPVPQVLIKVLIAEVTHDNTRDLGAEFSILNLRASGNGQTIGTDFGLGSATGGLVVRLIEENVTATIRLLEQTGKLDVLSRPYILASDNQLATITVGQRVPFPTNTRTTDDGDTISNITYEEIGILLDVVPHINPDGLVILDVAPEISSLTDGTIQISPDFNAPVFNTRSAESRVSIQNGQTVVIGGLMQDRKTETVRKVPLLGDLPGIGAAFRRHQRTKSKTELLIFLTPHVAAEPKTLEGMSQEETDGTKLLPGAVEDGAYEFHREGLRRGSKSSTVPQGGGARPGVEFDRDDEDDRTRSGGPRGREVGRERAPIDRGAGDGAEPRGRRRLGPDGATDAGEPSPGTRERGPRREPTDVEIDPGADREVRPEPSPARSEPAQEPDAAPTAPQNEADPDPASAPAQPGGGATEAQPTE